MKSFAYAIRKCQESIKKLKKILNTCRNLFKSVGCCLSTYVYIFKP